MEFVDFTPDDEHEIQQNKLDRRIKAQPTFKGIRKKRRLKSISRKNAPFISWDGEGTANPGGQQPYCHFGCLVPDGTKVTLTAPQLCTIEMLQLILYVGRNNPGAIHIGYSISYDVNQILWEWNAKNWQRLHEEYTLKDGRVIEEDECYWKGYYIKWIEGKFFEIAGIEQESNEYTRVKIYDIFSFFGSKFTKALEVWVPEYQGNSIIEEGKANRNEFTWTDIEKIKNYWKEEIEQLTVLGDTLRKNLREGAELELQHWYGPGAIANMLMKKHNIEAAMDRNIPIPVNNAAQHAYFAGRFEQWKAGLFIGDTYQFDINSAYPTAIAKLPNLAKGHWVHITDPEHIENFGVYRITGGPYRTREENRTYEILTACVPPRPLPYRTKNGNVHYPNYVNGWYWSPEAKLVQNNSYYQIHEGWIFIEDNSNDRPFKFVYDMYQKRLDFKKNKNPAELSIKLGLNSLYGKMVQSVGWDKENNLPPKYHQLEWAGWVTSHARAQLYPQLMKAWDQDALIACETDSVITSIDLKIGSKKKILGGWELKKYHGVLYLQNGVYFKNNSKTWEQRIRGMDKVADDEESKEGQIPMTFQHALEHMKHEDCFDTKILTTVTRFVGIKKALKRRRPNLHRQWLTENKETIIGGNGKRFHNSVKCRACKNGITNGLVLHDLAIGIKTIFMLHELSCPHKLPWLLKTGEQGGTDYEWRDHKEITESDDMSM